MGLERTDSSIIERLRPWARGPLLTLLGALVVLFSLFFFPARNHALDELAAETRATLEWQGSRVDAAASGAQPGGCHPCIFDVKVLGYTPAEARTLLAQLGPQGRDLYFSSQLTLDLLYPLLYGLLGCLLMARLFGADVDSRLAQSVRRGVVFLPWVAAVADLTENLLGLVLIARFEAGVADGWVRVASWCTQLKWLFVCLSVALVFVNGVRRIWSVRDRLAEFRTKLRVLVTYIMLLRVSVLSAVLLLGLAALGRSSLPTIENLMILESSRQLFVLTFVALQAGGIIGFTALITWDYAHLRFRIKKVSLPNVLAVPGVPRSVWFGLLGTPLIVQAVFRSVTPPNGRLGASDVFWGLLSGFVVACVAATVAELIRRWFAVRLGRPPRLLLWLFGLLGYGYLRKTPSGPRIHPGHTLAGVGWLLMGTLYAVGFFVLDPLRDGWLVESYPTLSYVVILLALVCFLLAGAAFFLDRFRFPLLPAVGLYLTLMARLFPHTHYFDVSLEPRTERPAAVEASTRRLELQAAGEGVEDVVTLVTLDGGGIRAAGWAVEVLTGLHAALGAEFTRSIHLVSGVSGGSVGTYFFVESLDPETGLPGPGALDAARRAVTRSSLEATAWGLVYPDFLGSLLPFRYAGRDRAWAIERAWLRSSARMRSEIRGYPSPLLAAADDGTRLSEWAGRARRGLLPAIVMNGTFVEDGQQFWASNLELSPLDPATESPVPSVADPNLSRHYDTLERPLSSPLSIADQFLDMGAVTAARLSATFPWVTPVARARPVQQVAGRWQKVDGVLPAYHVADGGYFDNFGTVAALHWLKEVFRDSSPSRSPYAGVRKLILIEVHSFPATESGPPDDERSWGFSTLAPLKTLLNVRSSSQSGRNNLEIDLLRDSWLIDTEIHHIVLQPRQAKDHPRRPAPVSWHLSRSDKRQLCRDWMGQRELVEHRLATLFPAAPGEWPEGDECERRLEF